MDKDLLVALKSVNVTMPHCASDKVDLYAVVRPVHDFPEKVVQG